MRHKTKQMWLRGQFTVLSDFSREKDAGNSLCDPDMHSSFDELKARYNLTGTESYNLVEAGLDSLDLVVFMHELKELLKDKGAEMLARQVDIGVIQRVSRSRAVWTRRTVEARSRRGAGSSAPFPCGFP